MIFSLKWTWYCLFEPRMMTMCAKHWYRCTDSTGCWNHLIGELSKSLVSCSSMQQLQLCSAYYGCQYMRSTILRWPKTRMARYYGLEIDIGSPMQPSSICTIRNLESSEMHKYQYHRNQAELQVTTPHGNGSQLQMESTAVEITISIV
jgi:hypothetical protein